MKFSTVFCLFALAIAQTPVEAYAELPARYGRPVKEVGPTLIEVPAPGGVAMFPIFTSADWRKPQPGITRAVLIFHGLLRNADGYYAAGLRAQKAAGPAGAASIVIAPQFLATGDIAPHDLPANTLGWGVDSWGGGEPAQTPAPLSGFDAIDAILAHLADRTVYPDLRTVVIAGFSAGGQIVQRYAVAGNGDAALARVGISTRYVVSDPSSYLYFSSDRPDPQPGCKLQNAWRYGFGSGVPPYVSQSAAALEARYVGRDVTYLMGMADTDPHHPVLDKSCAGEAQGPQRLARGHAYFDALKARHAADFHQRLIDVPGIAHEGGKMFNTTCGLAVLFGTPGCPDAER